MRRDRFPACLLAFTMIVGSAPVADAQSPVDERLLAAERILEQMLGSPPGPVTVVNEGAVTSYHADLTPDVMARLGAGRAASLQALSAGRSLSRPSSVSTLITGATMACGFSYYWWFGYVNFGSTTMKKITRTLKGPGNKMNNKGNVSFSGGTVGVKFENVPHRFGGDGGIAKYQVKGVGKGGTSKSKQNYLAIGSGC